MRKNRLDWVKKYEHWSEMDWRNVIFSDESKFCLFGSDGMQYVRRKPGERLSDKCIKKTVKHPAGQMVWGCFSYYGIGVLHFINGTVNADVYNSILQTSLVPSIENHFSQGSKCIFQDDSAPCHRAKRFVFFIFFISIHFTIN